MGEYARAATVGLKSFARAVLRWRENPFTLVVGKRLWGRFPLVTLALLTMAGIAAGPFFPGFDAIAVFVPPIAFLSWMPVDVTEMLWSVPALFALLVAWRVRRLRNDEPNAWLDLTDEEFPGRRIFEAGAIPIGAAATVLGLGLQVGPRLWAVSRGQTVDWGSSGSWLLGISGTLLTVAVVGGVLSLRKALGKAFGQLMGAAFTIFGLRLGLSYALPWMMGWWTYLPIPYVDRIAGERSPDYGLFLFNLAVVAIAWAKLRQHADESPFWKPDSDREATDGEAGSLPPLPTE